MGATVVNLKRDGRTGSLRKAPLSRHSEMTLTDTYWVATTSGTGDDAVVVMRANGLPHEGDPHPRVQGLVVTAIDPQPVAGRIDRWHVSVTYEREFHEDPDFDIDFELHRVPVMGATAVKRIQAGNPGGGSLADNGALIGLAAQQMLQWGEPVLNSAGEAFVPVPEDEEAWPVLHLSRNELVTELGDVWDFTNSLNAQPFLGKDPLQWWMMRRARPIPNSAAKWWRMEYVIRYNKFGWDLQLLDQGRYYRSQPGKPPAGDLIPFKDDEKNNVMGNLDGTGGALAAGGKPWFLHFRRKEVLDWGPLTLEDSIAAFYSARVEIEDPGLNNALRQARAAGFGL